MNDDFYERGRALFERHGIPTNGDITVTLSTEESSTLAAAMAMARELGLAKKKVTNRIGAKMFLATGRSLLDKFPDDDPEAPELRAEIEKMMQEHEQLLIES